MRRIQMNERCRNPLARLAALAINELAMRDDWREPSGIEEARAASSLRVDYYNLKNQRRQTVNADRGITEILNSEIQRELWKISFFSIVRDVKNI